MNRTTKNTTDSWHSGAAATTSNGWSFVGGVDGEESDPEIAALDDAVLDGLPDAAVFTVQEVPDLLRGYSLWRRDYLSTALTESPGTNEFRRPTALLE